jgi:energy-coupling factor transporter transmembrane protein EcfT
MTTQNFYEIKPLSVQDRKKLKRQYIYLIAFGVFVGAIFFVIYNSVLSTDKMGKIPVFVFSVFALIFSIVISYFFWSTYIDLKKGIKYCYSGIVTDKRINKHTTSSAQHNRAAGSHRNGSSLKNTQTHYYITIENKQHSVNYKQFSQVKINDKVYLEVSPKKKEVLAFNVLEKNTETTESYNSTIRKQNFDNIEKSLPMRENDIELVKKIFFKKTRKNLIYLIPITVLLFVLWKGIFIFLIPFIIAFVYYSFKFFIQINQYAKFKRNGYLKSLNKVKVIDKLKTTSNTKSTAFQIKTSNGVINVSEHIYNKVQAHQNLLLHKATFVNILYDVSIDELNS